MRRGSLRVRAAKGLGLSLAVVMALGVAAPASSAGGGGGPNVEVVNLSVDGRADEPLGLDNPRPTFAWQIVETANSANHRCYRVDRFLCPADKQTAYQVQLRTSQDPRVPGDLAWDTGKVTSSAQRVQYAGSDLQSRDIVTWRVRVWDADGRASNWSTSTWEVGLLEQSDWGDARWIDYPERTENQPMPIFARQFDVANSSEVTRARLYLSGIGQQLATVNGETITDEVLAPGNSNYQLSSEYRAYDVADALRNGSNTVGVELGNGPAYVRRSVTNPAVGRTSPYSWWQSQLKGQSVLAVEADAGATNVKLDSTTNYHVGGTINIDTGDGGDNLESRVITSIGTPATTTSLANPAAAGDTNIKLGSTAGLTAGDVLTIGSGANQEMRTIAEDGVGAATVATTLAADSVVADDGYVPPPTLTGANWIWNTPNSASSAPSGTIYVRKTFTVADPAAVAVAQLRINVDDTHTTFLNGTQIASSQVANGWRTSQIVDITPLLVAGTNVVAVAANNASGAGGMIAKVQVNLDGGASEVYPTDATWKALAGTPATPPAGWNEIAFDDAAWPAAFISGAYPLAPWNVIADPPGPNPSNIKVVSVAGFATGQEIHVGSGENQETRTIESVGTAGATGTGITVDAPFTIVHPTGTDVLQPGTGVTLTSALSSDHAAGTTVVALGTGISFTPGLDQSHAVGATVTGSGNNIAASDPSAGAAVTPRMIARLEISYADGTSEVIVSDRDWRTALGSYVTDAWYSGSDYDARRDQPGWNEAGSDLSPSAVRRDGTAMGWTAAGIAPPPNLATKLVGRTGDVVKIVEELDPVTLTNPAPGTWVFDFGQNFVGWPELHLPDGVPAGTTVRMTPAESLNADGTVNQSSLGVGGRGAHVFNTYTAAGIPGGETRHPDFGYFGMQWVQVTGLPEGFTPTLALLKGLRLQGSAPTAGEVSTSNDRINRLHTMARYSIASNVMSVFTDCPGREKLSYPADYTMPMGAISRNVELDAYLRTTMRHLVEGQSIADTPMRGNVALKTPVYDWGYTGRFGDEINWGNAIILVPAILYELYGDTDTMARYYDNMVLFADYIQREKVGTGADAHIVDAALSDWVAVEQTSGRIVGTWGYYTMISKLAMMAELTGHDEDAATYGALAEEIKAAFNAAFFNEELQRYTSTGNAGAAGATQTAQAIALDAGLVPEESRQAVLDALVELIYAFHPNGDGPHFSGGTIGMAPIIRALAEGGRDDVLWDLLQEDDYPSYGWMLQSTPANPNGLTTMPERWTLSDSKNHMILAQIEEWFHTGLAGIREAEDSIAFSKLVIQPKLVGDLTFVNGSYETPHGTVSTAWTRDESGNFELRVTIPGNTTAEVWVPTGGRAALTTPDRATFVRVDGDYAVYTVRSGDYTFRSLEKSYEDIAALLDGLTGQHPQIVASLRDRLDRAAAHAREGNEAPAIGMLKQIVTRATDQISGDAETIAIRDEIIEIATRLIEALEQEGDG